MDLDQLLKYILVLSPAEKKIIAEMLDNDISLLPENFFYSAQLTATEEWKEMQHRCDEVLKEQKTCLIGFDEHLQSLNAW